MDCAKCWKRWLCLLACAAVNDQFADVAPLPKWIQDGNVSFKILQEHSLFDFEYQVSVK